MGNLAQRWEPTSRVAWSDTGLAVTGPADPFLKRMNEVDNVDNLVFGAWRALRHDPGCIEAHLVLAEHSPDSSTRLAHLQCAVKAGDRLWGDEVETRRRYTDFWELIGCRPWLSALDQLGRAHAELGNTQAAEWVFERLLRLNPADDYEVRPVLQQLNPAPAMVF